MTVIILTADQRNHARSCGMTDVEYAAHIRESRAIMKAADALRKHEQARKKLNDWDVISLAQRKRWTAKATIVLAEYKAELSGEKK